MSDWRHLDAVDFAQMADDLTGVHRTIFSSKPGKRCWYFGNQLRIERRLPVAENIQLDAAGLGRHCLPTVAVAAGRDLIVYTENKCLNNTQSR